MWREFWLMRFLVNYRKHLGTPKEIDTFTKIGISRTVFIATIRRKKHSLPPLWFWFPSWIRKFYENTKYDFFRIRIPSKDEVLTQKYKRVGAVHRTHIEDCINDCIDNGYIEPLAIVDENNFPLEVAYIKPTKEGREYVKWTGFINKVLEKRNHLVALLTGGTIVAVIGFFARLLGLI